MHRLLALVIVLALLLPLTAAVADVTGAAPAGKGQVVVIRDNDGARYWVFLPRMSGDWSADMESYPFFTLSATEQKTILVSHMAPGQDYWICTVDSAYRMDTPYAYDAPETVSFQEFKNRPQITDFQLKRNNADGSTDKLRSISSAAIGEAVPGVEFGVAFSYTYPKLKNPRSYFSQIVITSPEGEKIVDYAYQDELPAGETNGHTKFYSLSHYFARILHFRDQVTPGTYIFALYWDGELVDSEPFTIRP